MELKRQFRLIAQKLVGEQTDLRHSILDICPEFRQATADLSSFPDFLKKEVQQIRSELEQVQPVFPSHRKTSPLFDREGMGQKGLKKANDLAGRIISVYRQLEKKSNPG